MKLFVGLGNPGPKYEVTRHNAGFLVLDLLLEHFGGSWQTKKFGGEFGLATVFGCKSLFLKPMTFMNLSGKSVAQALSFYKLGVEDLIVIHDDIDQASGKVKAKEGGGHGGHNGIRSILSTLGQGGFARIKIGVGRPEEGDNKRIEVSDWVLGKFTDAELLQLQEDVFDDVLLRIKGIFDRR
ncbi:MAG: aminoacyl-tRNA hydrolase [Bdellovibrionota bacterium]